MNIVTKVNMIENQQNRSWLGIGILLALLAVISLGIAACGTAPAQVTEDTSKLPVEISIDERSPECSE